jgi:large subunit ribosomal protein L10
MGRIGMNRQEKQAVIDAVKADFQKSQAAFVVATKGMNVAAVQELRSKLYAQNGKMKVVKNSLLKRATSDLPGLNELEPLFAEQVAVIFAQEAPVVAKLLYETATKSSVFVLKGGALDAKVISRAEIEHLAQLPSREVLLAMVCGTLQAPITNYVLLLNQLIVRLLIVLKQIEKTKQ